jgi:hypothetical protein
MPTKLNRKVDDPDRIPIHWQGVSSMIKKNLAMPNISLKEPDEDKLKPLMEKLKKPAEFWFTREGNKFTVDVRVGPNKTVLGTFDISTEKDRAKQKAIWDGLFANDLATRDDVAKFDQAHPDPKDVEALDNEIDRAQMDLNGDTADAKTIAKFHNYDEDDRAAGYNVTALLKYWLQDKHQSWVHYVSFVEDVDKPEDAKKIFDTYMKEGASLPINLPKGVQEPIEHALANDGKPDFAAARKLIVGIVNQKFIPEFKKDRLALYQKDIKEETEKLNALKKKKAAMGGK